MKQYFVLIALVLFSCSPSTNQYSTDTGGTSIEVTMVKGIVVNEMNQAVSGATVEILSHSGAALTQKVQTTSEGMFSEQVSFTGAIAVVVNDTSGNGAYKPCTLSTFISDLDVDTIRLQKIATLNLEFDYSEIEPATADEKRFRIECWELGKMWQFDSLGNFISDPLYSDSLQIPAGSYNFRLLPFVLDYQSQFMILDTVVTIVSGDNDITLTPLRVNINFTQNLKKDLETLHSVYKVNGFGDMTIQQLLNNVGIRDNRIILFHAKDIDTIPDFIDQLDQLEQILLVDSKITTLPASIGNMNNLKFIDLCITTDLNNYPNSITELPIELLDMENLTYFACGFAESVKELPEIIYQMNHVSTVYTKLSWSPSEREKEWALKRMYRGNQEEYDKWLAGLNTTYGNK